ncbi:MAG: hypothetical protein GF334_04635, partial [Candidatus Altiarchaeales archaeon]|nr:hypothetical protein [Candidatus Altiarchaeales archaeon]
YRRGVGDLIFDVDFDAVEVFNGHTFGNRSDPVKQAEAAGRNMVGGSDAHTLGELGGITVNVEGDLIESILAGGVQIKRMNPYLLFARHAGGLANRKFRQHVARRFSRN